MLEAYTDYLNKLNRSSTDDLAEKIALRLRFSAKPHEIERCTQSVRDLILEMPKITRQIHSWRGNSSLSAESKRLISDLAGCLHHPLDVIPHRGTLLAYLEDAFMAGYVFKRLWENAGTRELPASDDVLQWKDHLPLWLTHAKMVIPWEARKAERIVEEIIENQGWAGIPVIQQPVSSPQRLKSAVNVLKGGQTFDPPFSGQYAAA